MDIFEAVKTNNIKEVKRLIDEGADVNEKEAESLWTPLHWATSYEVAQLLINEGADVNAIDGVGFTKLHLACNSEKMEIIKLLTKNKANVNVRDDDGYTPLRYAYKNRNIQIADFLFENGARI